MALQNDEDSMGRLKRLSFIGSAFAILLLCTLPRFTHLDADPPTQFSLGFISDEGWWVHNARQAALFNRWIMDEFNQGVLISPLFSLLSYVSFSLFGSSFFAARVPSALAGILSVLLCLFWFPRTNGRVFSKGLIAATLLGFNYFFFCFNRVALVDSLLITMLLLSFLCWSRSRGMVGAAAAAVAFAGAFLVKPIAIYGLLVFFLTWVWEFVGEKLQWTRIIAFLSVGMVLAGIWFYFIYPDFFQQFWALNIRFSRDNLPHNVHDLLRGILYFFYEIHSKMMKLNFFFSYTWLLWIILALRAAELLAPMKSMCRSVKSMSRSQFMALSWLCVAVITLAPNPYKPERRFLFLLAPLVLLCADTIHAYAVQRLFRLPNRWGAAFILSLVMTLISFPTFARWHSVLFRPPLNSVSETAAIVFISFSILFISFGTIIGLIQNKKMLSGRYSSRILLLGIIIAYLLLNWLLIGKSLRCPSYSLRNTSLAMARKLKSGDIVGGGVADSLLMETKARAIMPFDAGENLRFNREAYAQFRPENLLLLSRVGEARLPIKGELPKEKVVPHLYKKLFLLPLSSCHPTEEYRVEVQWYKLSYDTPFLPDNVSKSEL